MGGGTNDSLIYCAAFDASLTSSSPPWQQQISEGNFINTLVRGGNSLWTSGLTASILIGNLLPFNAYRVYCLSQSTDGVTSPLSNVLQSYRNVTTLCCRTVEIDLTFNSVFSNQSYATGAVITLIDMPPQISGYLTITLRVRKFGSPSWNNIETRSFSPNQVNYTYQSSYLLSQNVIAFTGISVPGNYEITVVLSGPFSPYYTTSYVRGSSFQVIGPSDSPQLPPPAIVSASFSIDGTYIILLFNSRTDRAMSLIPTQGSFYFQCASLLRFIGVKEAKCRWSEDSLSILVYPMSTIAYQPASSKLTKSSITPGDIITVLGGTIKAQCTTGFNLTGDPSSRCTK